MDSLSALRELSVASPKEQRPLTLFKAAVQRVILRSAQLANSAAILVGFQRT